MSIIINSFTKKNNYFIGASGNEISKFLYDGITDVNQNHIEEIFISPNPTGSFVNINLNCSEPQINYHINDVNGLLLFQENVPNQVGNSLQIDFTQYPNGIYFITLICNHIPKTYKIVKEG